MKEFNLTPEERLEEEKLAISLQKAVKGEPLSSTWPQDPEKRELYENALQAYKDALISRYRMGKNFILILLHEDEKEFGQIIQQIWSETVRDLGLPEEIMPQRLDRQEAERIMYFAKVVDQMNIVFPPEDSWGSGPMQIH